MSKRKDDRPICTCRAYSFPHRVGGKCDGSTFAEFYYSNTQTDCLGCNCNGLDGCEVASGAESIELAECHITAQRRHPGEQLIMSFNHLFSRHSW